MQLQDLDTLKQRRKTTQERAHQLNKVNRDSKYYPMRIESLKFLRKCVRKMDEDIRWEETLLIDHKQTATEVWMRLKFGGLHGCCEKAGSAIFLSLVPHLFFYLFYVYLDCGQIWKICHCRKY